MARDCINRRRARTGRLPRDRAMARLKQAMLAPRLEARKRCLHVRLEAMFSRRGSGQHEARPTEECRSFRAMMRGVVGLA